MSQTGKVDFLFNIYFFLLNKKYNPLKINIFKFERFGEIHWGFFNFHKFLNSFSPFYDRNLTI
ncbi:hypothetical protein P872_15005 [Rhodonellum psychrophilum GCM71 = DSM 17998]|uniref:Uncharacterized protein n=1 Tax=Rhodonellum psychrophilum GCM71 = DSM 17998 TaxID=1123057 RepID=U5C853_9BACT|nr:hypothetical protein P872_15005 [Rhodonellum psychrophilum GCM71 = DSM 17998]